VIFGIGVDILHQARIQKIWDRHGVKLADKLLCEAERVAFAQAKNPVRFLSMAFAAKEACVKALGSGFEGVAYRDIGAIRETSGKPVLAFSARMQARLTTLGITASHVSLSDDSGLICAMVVLETPSQAL
jgi:holo-[acyl-carrier protein] synthase